jgi:hypothetical protein
MDVLTVDVGGMHVKVLARGHDEPRKFVSGRALTPERQLDEQSHSAIPKIQQGAMKNIAKW